MSSAKTALRIESLIGSEVIRIYQIRNEYFIFDPKSIILCLKINMQVDLIGPYPRQLTSENTSLPGLLTLYQADILRQAPKNCHFFDGDFHLKDLEQTEKEKIDDVYQKIESEVTKQHALIAKTYGQQIDIEKLMMNFGKVPQEKLRWHVNLLETLVDCPRIDPIIVPEMDDEINFCHYDLWAAGIFLTSGLKFGCDWLAYQGSPDLFHATHVVSVVKFNKKLKSSDISCLTRIATKNRKKLLLMSLDEEKQVVSCEIAWCERLS